MLSVTDIKKLLEDRNLRIVAERAGVHYQTLYRIAKKPGYNPSSLTVEKLSEYLS